MTIDENLTIYKMFHNSASRFPENRAIEYLDRAYTYAEAEREADAMARGLVALGIEKGEFVGIISENSDRFLLAFLAVEKIGAVSVLIGKKLKDAEINALLKDTGVTRLIYGNGSMNDGAEGRGITERFSGMRSYISLEECDNGETVSLGSLKQLGDAIPEAAAEREVRGSDTDVVLFTSGTTGREKGVLTTHAARANLSYCLALEQRAGPSDKFCVMLPVHHCFSLSSCVLAALSVGACVCFTRDHHAESVLWQIENSRCTVLTSVPTLFSVLADRQEEKHYDLSSLRNGMIGGSTYSPETFRRICGVLGFNLLPSLGQTEATAGMTSAGYDDPIDVKEKTVGHFLEGIEGRICLRDSEEEAQSGQIGEICIRGYTVMLGYFGNPELTKKTIDSKGWLHTGDVGYLDGSGNLHMVGRIKDIIIRGGENIAAAEIENIIAADPRVEQVRVLGVPDAYYIEEICACVITREKMSESDVRSIVSSQLADFKVPKYVLFFDDFPLLDSGKICTAKLQEQVKRRLEK